MNRIEGKQFFDEYIMIAPGSDYGNAMWSDIGKVDNAILFRDVMRDDANKVERLLHHIHFSFVLNRKTDLPLQSIWKKSYSLETVPLRNDKRYCIIYTDISACRTDMDYLKMLSHKKNVTLVMMMVNTVDKKKRLVRSRLRFFDMVFSFDKEDCRRYHAIYHPMNYSINEEISSAPVKYDAFFVGMAKDRLPVLVDVFRRIRQHNGKALFYISGVPKNKTSRSGIIYNQWLDYKQVLENVSHSNCLVEVVDADQTGNTLRTMEAICYNKRLLTNNASIKDSPFYKSGFIQVFDDPKDIDIDFVTDRSPVDYHYMDEFSPVHLLEHINQVVQGRAEKSASV